MILNRLQSCFSARSVGSENRLSGSSNRMLLSCSISSVRKNDSFDILKLVNIIQGVMEYGPTIGARLSCVTMKQSDITFWRSMTRWRAGRVSSIEIMVVSNFFHQNSMSKAIIHGNQGFAHKDFGVSCPFSISDVVVRSSSNVGNFFQAQYRSRALESSKVVLNNPPKCGASTFTTLDHQVLNLNQFQTSRFARSKFLHFEVLAFDKTSS